ncbi:glycosyltransferase family 39 protein [Nitrosopumilus sp.]|uniref:glycosyltransferase family 39 protein n=1 Tax=Nitrosopumilus sp. TaxID=2024843 RepID=UPI003D12224E
MIQQFERLDSFSKNILFLICLVVTGFVIRINYSLLDIPIILDSLDYFLVANELAISGNVGEYSKQNLGWPLFLSIIFQISRFENYFELMNIQRIFSVIFSTLAIVPVFLLSKKFFNSSIALVGGTFFAFSPYIIENSFIGSNESLFIFLIGMFFVLFFQKEKNQVITSFIFLGLATIVRYEGILFILPAAIIFLNKFKNEKNYKKYFMISLVLFSSSIILMSFWRFSMGMSDGFIVNFISGGSVVINEETIKGEPLETRFYLERGIFGLLEFSGRLLLPICLFFVPYSIITLIKKQKKDFFNLILLAVFYLIVPIYAYGRGFEDIKYVFVLFPIFIICSLFLVEKISIKTQKNNLIIFILIILIVSSSIVFLESRKSDKQEILEVVKIAKIVHELPGKINDYGTESYYVEPMYFGNIEFPIHSQDIQREHKVKRISGDTIEELMNDAKSKDLKYLAVSEKSNNKNFSDIYYNNQKYSFLVKIFDSENTHEKFKIKIFEIDYGKLNLKN